MSPLEFLTLEQQEARRAEALSRGRYLVTERLCRTHDGRVVPEDQCTEGGSLLFTAGTEIPLEEAQRYGLVAETKAEAKPEDKAVGRAEVEDKATRRRPGAK